MVRIAFLKESDIAISKSRNEEETTGLNTDVGSACLTADKQHRRGNTNAPLERPRTSFSFSLPDLSETTCHLNLNDSRVASRNQGILEYFQYNDIHF